MRYYTRNFQPGCYVDGSHASIEAATEWFIHFAKPFGFEPAGKFTGKLDIEDAFELTYEVVDFLNRLETRDGYYWEVDDNSLCLVNEVEE